MLNNQDNATEELQQGADADSPGEGRLASLQQSLQTDLDENGEDFDLLDEGEGEPEPGSEGQHVEGINVDLSSMSREELLAYDEEHPGAIQSQLMMQSAFTKRTTEIKAREAEIQRQQVSIAQQQQGLTTLLTQLGGQQQVQPVPGQLAPQAPPPPPPVAPQVPGESSETPNLDAHVQRIMTQQNAQNEAQYGTAIAANQKAVADMQMQQFKAEVQRKFEGLAEDYPQTAKPEVRAKIEQAMIDLSTANPELAFLSLCAPSLRKRQKAAKAKKEKSRQETPATGKGKKAQTRGGKPPDTLADAKTAALAYGRANPDAFDEPGVIAPVKK